MHGKPPAKDFHVSKLCMVSYRFRSFENGIKDGGEQKWSSDFMHVDHVPIWLKAKLLLHFEPGINPFSKLACAVLWEVKIHRFDTVADYWHTTENLGQAPKFRNSVPYKDLDRAEIFCHFDDEILWSHPLLIEHRCQQQELQEQMEAETIRRMDELNTGLACKQCKQVRPFSEFPINGAECEHCMADNAAEAESLRIHEVER